MLQLLIQSVLNAMIIIIITILFGSQYRLKKYCYDFFLQTKILFVPVSRFEFVIRSVDKMKTASHNIINYSGNGYG